MSLMPVRCFTCKKPVGQYQISYECLLKYNSHLSDEELETVRHEFFISNRINRSCCRAIFLGYTDISDKLLAYDPVTNRNKD